MRVSVEIPAFKGRYLMEAIESVLRQTSPQWELSVIWDGGDELARTIVEELDRMGEERIRGYIGDRRGIANARRFLTERSTAEWILPLDDDDLLAPDAVECFLRVAAERPWAGIVRARRAFIDEQSQLVQMAEWFPFEPRHYRYGMTVDLFNHCQPGLIRRTAYAKTAGWRGFEDYHFAGEDCDIFVQIEEVAPIELYDRVLYFYRLNSQRTSLELGPAGAKEMWRRIADEAIARMQLPLRRMNSEPPFQYERTASQPLTLDRIDFVIFGAGDSRATRRALRQAGVSDYCMRACSGLGSSNDAARASRSPALCCLPAGALPTVADLRSLLDLSRTNELVLKSFGHQPVPVLLVRREVLHAVGGFDQALMDPELATLDLCLKARSRDFSCSTEPSGSTSRMGVDTTFPVDLNYFVARWGLDASPAAMPTKGPRLL